MLYLPFAITPKKIEPDGIYLFALSVSTIDLSENGNYIHREVFSNAWSSYLSQVK